MIKPVIAAALLSAYATSSFSASVTPTSYEMQNGQGSGIGGTFSYRDESYDGPGAPVGSELAFLTGGTGDLTDGFIATQNWNAGGQATSTPYVGWFSIDPRITFKFGAVTDFNSVTFHFDTSNAGGVRRPSSVEVNDSFVSILPNSANPAPYAHTIDLSSVAPTNALTFDIFRQTGSWVFLSEVTFDADVSAVPVPASGLLLIAGMGGIAALRRRRSR